MTGLLVIDIQNFYEKTLVNFKKTCENAGKIINKFRENNFPVFYIQHIKKVPVINKLVPLEKIKEFQIHESVKPVEGEPIIQKYHINCFRPQLLELCKGILYTHIQINIGIKIVAGYRIKLRQFYRKEIVESLVKCIFFANTNMASVLMNGPAPG